MLLGVLSYLLCALAGSLWGYLSQEPRRSRWSYLSGVPMIVGLGIGLYGGAATGYGLDSWQPWAFTLAAFLCGSLLGRRRAP